MEVHLNIGKNTDRKHTDNVKELSVNISYYIYGSTNPDNIAFAGKNLYSFMKEESKLMFWDRF